MPDIKLVQKRIANISIGASTARGLPTGTVVTARKYLTRLDLRNFNLDDEANFLKVLNARTNYLKGRLPRGAKHWGMARKFLNIFLLECSYNKYISRYYKLSKLERWLEVPLDRQVGNGLRKKQREIQKQKKQKKKSNPKTLPSWPGVSHLIKKESDKYQIFAKQDPNRKKVRAVARVHLDLFYWRRNPIN